MKVVEISRLAIMTVNTYPFQHVHRPVRRVLMLAHRIPYPPDRGDRIRSFHILRELAGHYEVSLACCSDMPADIEQQRVLQSLTSRFAVEPISPMSGRCRGSLAFLTGEAVTPSIFYSPKLAKTVINWHHQRPFDAVFIYCTGMVRYARELVAASNGMAMRQVLDLVDVDSVKWRHYAELASGPMRWVYAAESKRLRRIESGGNDPFDAITVVSEAEASVYRREVGYSPGLSVVGNGVDLDYFKPLDDPDNHLMVFVGVLNYKPNVDGVSWFVERVMPQLRRRMPDARLLIVGRDVSPRIQQLARHRYVEVVGPVRDVREQLSRASVVIAPLRISPGIQNKVLEAMASSRAVVCSPGAGQGIDAESGTHLVTAGSTHEYVSHITRLMNFKSHRLAIASAARRRVQERYAWSEVLRPLIDLVGGRRPEGEANHRPMFDAA